MSECYVGEIRMFGGNYAPEGWHLCDGSLLKVTDNQVLFALIGTIYGGDGVRDFALPDLRGRLPISAGQGPDLANHNLAEKAGSETVTLTPSELPVHPHTFLASTDIATSDKPTTSLAVAAAPSGYISFMPITAAGNVSRTFDNTTVSGSGNSQPHTNMMPSLAINFIIALQGIYPQHA